MADSVQDLAQDVAREAAEKAGYGRAIGLMIAALALFLAAADILGDDAQTNGLSYNIEASNTWNFFQAKTVRQSNLRALIEQARANDADQTEKQQRQIAAWQATVERWESEPSTNEGRKELLAKATALEVKRDKSFSKDNAFDATALVLQLGIVLASVALISGMTAFALAGLGMGVIGVLMLTGVYLDWTIVMAVLG